MTFSSYCVFHTSAAQTRIEQLLVSLQRRRLVRERRARLWRLWAVVEGR